MSPKTKNAFTLVELLTTIFIFTLVIAGIYSIFLVGNRSWATYNNNVTLQREVRNVLMMFARDLREAHGVVINKDAVSTSIRFIRPGTGVMSYSWSGVGNDTNQLIRRTENNSRILAQHIAAVEFFYPDNKAVIIDLTATVKPTFGPPMSWRAKEKIALRSHITYNEH